MFPPPDSMYDGARNIGVMTEVNMTRPILMLALAACLAVACGQSNSPQSAPAGQAAPAAGPAGQPQTPESTPAATPEARPTGTSAPASNPAAPPSTSAAAQPSSAPSSEPPAPPPAPKFRELTIPAGTSLSVTVLSTLASNKSKVEDPVKGSLAKPVTVSGFTAIPSGAQISGNVTAAEESGRVKGKATIAFRFNRLVVRDEAIPIQTAQVTRVAAQDTAGDVKKGGLGAGAG